VLVENEVLLLRLALTIHRAVACASAWAGAIAGATTPTLALSLPFAFAAPLTESRTFGAWSALRTVAAIFSKTLRLARGAFLVRFRRASVTSTVSRAIAREGHRHSAEQQAHCDQATDNCAFHNFDFVGLLMFSFVGRNHCAHFNKTDHARINGQRTLRLQNCNGLFAVSILTSGGARRLLEAGK
jgi:hypothetical protein